MKIVNEKPKATPVCDHLEYLMAMKEVEVDDCYFDELYGIELVLSLCFLLKCQNP